jgi:FkbM family methyltransferase
MRINVNTASYIEWHLFFFGYYERHVVKLMKRLLRPGDVAFDIGANVGCHTLIMSSLVAETGKVFAFEPHPSIFEKLRSNLDLNDADNVVPLPYAMSAASGDAILYSFDEAYANQGMSSLSPLDEPRATLRFPVQCRSVDEIAQSQYLERLDLIKIDTEGHEADVITGARESIAKFKPRVVLEYNRKAWKRAGNQFEDVITLFSEIEYEVMLIRRSGCTVKVPGGLPAAANLLAAPSGGLHAN